MFKEKIINITKPALQNESLHELNKLKSFVDASLKEVLIKKFDNDVEKCKYLLTSLYQIRDYILSQITENSLRSDLIKQFQMIEEEIEMGNELEEPEKKLPKKIDVYSEPAL